MAETARKTPTIVFSNSEAEEKVRVLESKGVEVIRQNARDLRAVMDELKRRELQSVLVEGGTGIAGAFVDAKLIDKVSFFVAPIIIGGHDAPKAIGGKGAAELADALRLKEIEIVKLGEDLRITGYPRQKDES